MTQRLLVLETFRIPQKKLKRLLCKNILSMLRSSARSSEKPLGGGGIYPSPQVRARVKMLILRFSGQGQVKCQILVFLDDEA